jgi:transcriptional regulator with XRE-family HTH domain
MSEQLRQARIRAGVTIEQIAAKSGVSRGTLHRAEKGKEAINAVNAARIVNALNSLAGTSYTPESLNMLVSD